MTRYLPPGQALPPARVMGRVGRRAAFEVVVDGVLVHSKLATSRFPDFRWGLAAF